MLLCASTPSRLLNLQVHHLLLIISFLLIGTRFHGVYPTLVSLSPACTAAITAHSTGASLSYFKYVVAHPSFRIFSTSSPPLFIMKSSSPLQRGMACLCCRKRKMVSSNLRSRRVFCSPRLNYPLRNVMAPVLSVLNASSLIDRPNVITMKRSRPVAHRCSSRRSPSWRPGCVSLRRSRRNHQRALLPLQWVQ